MGCGALISVGAPAEPELEEKGVFVAGMGRTVVVVLKPEVGRGGIRVARDHRTKSDSRREPKVTRILKVVGTQREVEVMIGLENGRAGGPEGIGPGAEKRLGTEQKCSAARGVAFLRQLYASPIP